ncbi:hypothetical protein VitviT2T_016718 [Vitis vinifera]|uniref:BSD domain-containing protein n=1 Tax=Vitis vinifera TaxID=29760 RepID=A0ABY9CRF5_VITVI|nr:hypothetical protein VitviT2T_016718 [Vitis vinifera]
MSDIQREHASTIERLAPSFADLRLQLCSYMSDGQFWMIYFILLLPRLNVHDSKLLSTPKARFLKMLKVLVERKTFLIRLEGEQGGEWCSITEISRGSVFALGFEKEAVGWLADYLTKALTLKSHMGFNKKFRGKCRVHLMEVGFNNHGRFIRISEFATNRKPSVLIIPEGDKGRGWENIKKALSSLLVVPYPNVTEKGRNIRGES